MYIKQTDVGTIQHDGFLHPLGVEQGYIDNGLLDTDVSVSERNLRLTVSFPPG
jgi:hypothetical protein